MNIDITALQFSENGEREEPTQALKEYGYTELNPYVLGANLNYLFYTNNKNFEALSNKSDFIAPPTLSVGDGGVVSATSFLRNSNFLGEHTATKWTFSLHEDMSEPFHSTVSTSNLYSYSTQLPITTEIFVEVAFIAGEHVGKSSFISFVSPNYYIDLPIFTLETDSGKAVNLADVTLSALPNTINCTIDTIEFRITRTSDSVVIDTQSTTNLALPIIFESQNLEENTEYIFEVRCRDTILNIDSAWSSVQLFTLASFLPRFNPISTKSCVALYLLNGNANDEGGIYNGVWEETEAYITIADRSVGKFDDGSIRLPIDVEVTSKLNFTISFSIKSTTATQSGTTVYSEGLDSVANGLSLYYYPSSTAYSVSNYNSASNPIFYGNLQAQTPLNIFVHHVIVRTNTLWELYENGVKTAEYISDSTVFSPAYIPLIGDTDYSNGRNFVGELANFRFYHESLSAEEATIIYEEDKIV